MTTNETGWQDVPEGTMYTTEQYLEWFHNEPREEQDFVLKLGWDAVKASSTCAIQDHSGALRFARGHKCPPDRYEQGRQDAIAEFKEEWEKERGKSD